jgi:hypothetical protein
LLIKEIQKNKSKTKKEKKFKFLKQEQELQKLLKTNISIKANKEKKGFIKIKFQNIEKLEKIIEKIKK